jgi:hypothetical protein
VQSALLEAMGERQVTVGRATYALPALFLVMATQNPIEQEGTYPLPEAQLDRFLLRVRVDYPDIDTEKAILNLACDEAAAGPRQTSTRRVSQAAVFEARRLGIGIHGRVLATRAGGHLSPFRGPGVEYDESRAFVPGDDPRNMDWRVTARCARPCVKLFRDERERPLWLLVDQGVGMRFATRVAFKSVIAARAAALLGWAAVDRRPSGRPGASGQPGVRDQRLCRADAGQRRLAAAAVRARRGGVGVGARPDRGTGAAGGPLSNPRCRWRAPFARYPQRWSPSAV